MPYPLEDRELVFISLWERLENNDYFVVQTTTEHPEFPPADDVVQMELTRTFRVCQVGPRRISVEVVAYMDMGGSIPTWVNTRITIPSMSKSSIGIQLYVCEGKPLLLQYVH